MHTLNMFHTQKDDAVEAILHKNASGDVIVRFFPLDQVH